LAQRWPTSYVTRTPLSRSKVKVTSPLCSSPCWRVRRLQRWAWKLVGRGKLLLRCRLLGGARRFGVHGGRRGGAYRGGRPPTACLKQHCWLLPALRLTEVTMRGKSLRLAGKILVLVKLMALTIYAKPGPKAKDFASRPRTDITDQ